MLGTILLIILILMLRGALPAWPHSRRWGYGPTDRRAWLGRRHPANTYLDGTNLIRPQIVDREEWLAARE